MSRKGNCWDNSIAESFFKTIKVEFVYKNPFSTQDQAKLSLFNWIETWYNKKRRHSALGYKTMEEYELINSNQNLAAWYLPIRAGFSCISSVAFHSIGRRKVYVLTRRAKEIWNTRKRVRPIEKILTPDLTPLKNKSLTSYLLARLSVFIW